MVAKQISFAIYTYDTESNVGVTPEIKLLKSIYPGEIVLTVPILEVSKSEIK